MNIQVEPRTLSGTVSIPASKSMTHRMLICAALAEGTSVIEHVSFSKDITATMEALSALGADFETNGSTITVTGINQVATTQTAEMNCCESGSTLRFLIMQHSTDKADCRSVQLLPMYGNFLRMALLLIIRTPCRSRFTDSCKAERII